MSRARRTVTLAVVAALVAAAALAGVAAGQDQVTITVTVVDGDDDPVSGVELTASWDGGEVTETTRSNGQALVDVPDGADVTIEVDHADYVRNEPFELDGVSGGDIEIPVVRSGTATVEVVDADGPVDQAIVRLRQGGDLVVNDRTGSDGRYETDRIERDTYRLIVYKEGYARNSTDLDVDGDVEHTSTIGESAAALTVSVVDDHFDPPEPVREATVTVGDVGTVQTLAGGETTVSVPVNDRYDVTVNKDGYEETDATVEVDESATRENLTIQRTPEVNITAANRRVVTGESVSVTVVDEYGDPVEGATISLDGDDVGTTDSNGGLRVSIDDPGEHTLGADHDGLTDETTVEGDRPDGSTVTPTATATEENGPGFTALTAVLAVAGVALLARRRIQ